MSYNGAKAARRRARGILRIGVVVEADYSVEGLFMKNWMRMTAPPLRREEDDAAGRR